MPGEQHTSHYRRQTSPKAEESSEFAMSQILCGANLEDGSYQPVGYNAVNSKSAQDCIYGDGLVEQTCQPFQTDRDTGYTSNGRHDGCVSNMGNEHDISDHLESISSETRDEMIKGLLPDSTNQDAIEDQFDVDDMFESFEHKDDIFCADDAANSTETKRRKKNKTGTPDKLYRSDREFVKRHSHKKMIWFLRKAGVRHPAAIRTHLEKVKHPEFELPNLQCVYPHPSLAVACDDRETESGSKRGNRNEINTPLTYYQIYCATKTLVERVKKIVGAREGNDDEYNKKVLTFIADIVGRLLWHNNRTHAVMFAKSDHLDRGCFLLYSRTTEPPPYFMKSDEYFCRRHDTEKFKNIAPQPDLTRANSARVSNDSCIYVVGCNIAEVYETFPYEYRNTHCRQMKPLYERIKTIDPAVIEHSFSFINEYVNMSSEQSCYIEVASKPTCDILSLFLRDPDIKDMPVDDDSPTFRNFVERFIMIGVINVHCMLKWRRESIYPPDHRDKSTQQTPSDRLGKMVLHHIGYRRESRQLRTNKIFYYRNDHDFICSFTLLDDMYEEVGALNRDVSQSMVVDKRCVYFYDLLQPFRYEGAESLNVNELAFQAWDELSTMIEESSHTIRRRISADILKHPPCDDPFYPMSDMSANDVAIDRMLERVIKHSKNVKQPSMLQREKRPVSCDETVQTTKRGKTSRSRKRKSTENTATNSSQVGLDIVDHSPGVDKERVEHSLSKQGDNRLWDGYVSPQRPIYESTHYVELEGERQPVKISAVHEGLVASGSKTWKPIDYGLKPNVIVDRNLVCAYLINKTDTHQMQILSGRQIIDRHKPDYVELNLSDRILRVFAIKATDVNTYVVKPYVYIVFRNMPTCKGLNDSLVDRLADEVKTYDDFEGFDVLDNTPTSQEIPPSSKAPREDIKSKYFDETGLKSGAEYIFNEMSNNDHSQDIYITPDLQPQQSSGSSNDWSLGPKSSVYFTT